MLQAMTLSSRNKRFVRTKRPHIRNNMIVTAMPVHHQLNSNVGLFCTLVLAAGGMWSLRLERTLNIIIVTAATSRGPP